MTIFKNTKNWHRGLIFDRLDAPQISSSENPQKRAEKILKEKSDYAENSIDERMDLDVGDQLVDSEVQDAVDKIASVRKLIDKKRATYYEVVRNMYYKTVKENASDIVNAEYAEKVALAYKDLVDSYSDVIKIQEESKDPEFVRQLAGDLLKVEVPLIKTVTVNKTRDVPVMDLMELSDINNVQKAANRKQAYVETKIQIVKKTYEIPKNAEKYNILKNGAEMAVLGSRADLFLTTRDQAYEKFYHQNIEQRSKNMHANGKVAIKRAEEADGKGLSKVQNVIRLQDNAEKYQAIDGYTTMLAQKQLEIEKMRVADPVKACSLANEFSLLVGNLKKNMVGSSIDKKIDQRFFGLPVDTLEISVGFFEDLKKTSPKVFERFSQIIDIYHNKAVGLAQDIIQRDPEIIQFKCDLSGFIKSGEGLFKTFENLNKEIARGQSPSQPYMEKIHEELEIYINSPYFRDIKKNWPRQKYLSYLSQDLSAIPGAKKMIETWENAYKALDQYKAQILQVSAQINDMGGDNVDWTGFLKDAGKFALVIAACVATGGAMTAIVANTFTTLSSIAAVSTLGNASLDYLDGNGNAFDPNALMEGYMNSLGVSWASGVLAKPIGGLWGKYARKLNDKMASSDIGWIKTFAERGYVNKIFANGEGSFGTRFTSEMLEESLEDGMKRLGEAVAPKHPLLGAIFQIIGTSARVARGVFNRGPFKIGEIYGQVTDSGVKLEYTNLNEIKAFLLARGLDAESISRLEQEGGLVIEKDGIRLEVENVEVVSTDKLDAGFINGLKSKYVWVSPVRDCGLIYVQRRDGSYTFVKKNGQEINAVKYKQVVTWFEDGYAGVQREDGSYTFIDRQGREINDKKYKDIDGFTGFSKHDGYAVVMREDGSYTFLNLRGREINDKKYARTIYGFRPFSDGYVLVRREDGSYTMIDENGNELCSVKYKFIQGSFEFGYVGVQRPDGSWNFIDKKGKEINSVRYGAAGHFDESGYAWVERLDGWSTFIDKRGNEISKLGYHDVGGFYYGYSSAQRPDTSWTFIDKKGREITSKGYKTAMPFEADGYAKVVRLDGSKAKIDKNGVESDAKWDDKWNDIGKVKPAAATQFEPVPIFDNSQNQYRDFREKFPGELGSAIFMKFGKLSWSDHAPNVLIVDSLNSGDISIGQFLSERGYKVEVGSNGVEFEVNGQKFIIILKNSY
ncbi:MAG: WG repeat-containing protein [Patescibacteria group bacterium]